MTTQNRTHTVQSGETLSVIARKFKQETRDSRSIADIMAAIQQANAQRITDINRIQERWVLTMPEVQTTPAAAPATPTAAVAPATPRAPARTARTPVPDPGTGNSHIIRRENRADGAHYDTVDTIARAWIQANQDQVGQGQRFPDHSAVQQEILKINHLNITQGRTRCGTVIQGVVYLTPGATLHLPAGNPITAPPLVHERDCGAHRRSVTEGRHPAVVTTPVTAIFNPRTTLETNGTFPRLDPSKGRVLAPNIGGIASYILWHAGPADRVAPDGPSVWGPEDRAANGVRTTRPGVRINGDLNSTRGQETAASVENGWRAEGVRDQGNDRRLASGVGPRLIRLADGRDVAVGADFYRTIDRDVVLNSVYRSWLPIGGTMWREGWTGQAVFQDIGRTAEGVDALNRLHANYRAMDILHAQLPAHLHVGAPAASANAARLTPEELATARRFFNLSLQNLGNPIVWSNEQRDGLPGWDSVTQELRAFMNRVPPANRAEFTSRYQELGLNSGVRNPNEFMRRARQSGILADSPYEILLPERANQPHVQQGLRITEELRNPERRAHWERTLGEKVNRRLDAPETKDYVAQEGRDRAREGLLRQEVTMALLRADADKRMASDTLRGAWDQERKAATGITRVRDGDVVAAQAATNVGSMRHLLRVIGENQQITSATLHLMANTPGGIEALLGMGHLATAGRNGLFDRDGDKQAKAIGGFETRAQAVATMRQLEKDLGVRQGHFTLDDPNLFQQGANGLLRFISAGLVRTHATMNAGDNQQENYQAKLREILSKPGTPEYNRLMSYARQMYQHAAGAEDARPAAALATFLAPSIHTDRSARARNSERYPLAEHYQNMLVEIAGVSRRQNQPHSFQSVADVRRAAEVQEAINNNGFTGRAVAEIHERMNDAGAGVNSRNVPATRTQIDQIVTADGVVPATSEAGRALAVQGVQVTVVTAAGQTPQVTEAQRAIAALSPRDRAAIEVGRIDPRNVNQVNAVGTMLGALAAGPADRNVARGQFDAVLGQQTALQNGAFYGNVILDALTSNHAATRNAVRSSLESFAQGGQGHRELANQLLAMGDQLSRTSSAQQRSAMRSGFQTELLTIAANESSGRSLGSLATHLTATTNGTFNALLSGRLGQLGETGAGSIQRMLAGIPEAQRGAVAQSMLNLANGQGDPNRALGMLNDQVQGLLSHGGISYVEVIKWAALIAGIASLGGGGGGGTPPSPFRPVDPTKPTTWPIPNPSGPSVIPPDPTGGFRPR